MATAEKLSGIPYGKAFTKRGFDILLALIALLAVWWVILLAAVAAHFDTGMNGFFVQKRVGRYGKLFAVVKIRTMRQVAGVESSVTTASDERTTSLGKFFRKTKIDELPQLINILLGDMSFVGPRPDVPGFADKLVGDERLILTIRPGMTGPATLKYRNEEQLLENVDNPEEYNREVIYPDKVRINMQYIRRYSILGDLKYILKTIFTH